MGLLDHLTEIVRNGLMFAPPGLPSGMRSTKVLARGAKDSQDLPQKFLRFSIANPPEQHGDVNADMFTCRGLAQDMCALEVRERELLAI